jgi:hypothetical protein
MANSVITNPSSAVKGAIGSVTKTKTANDNNYLSSGLNANNNVVIAEYESSDNPLGVACTLGRVGNEVYAYLYRADGTPYIGAASLTFHYIPIA